MSVALHLSLFWAMQVVAQLFFKWGSLQEAQWLNGFLLGNLFGFSSIWLLMLVYRELHPNVALGLATAGAFLFSQIAIWLVFKSSLNLVQWGGTFIIVVGVMLLATGGKWEQVSG